MALSRLCRGPGLTLSSSRAAISCLARVDTSGTSQASCLKPLTHSCARTFSSSCRRLGLYSLKDIPQRIGVEVQQIDNSELLCLKWSQAPRNILLVKKDNNQRTTEALVDFAHHVVNDYPEINLVVEPRVAEKLKSLVPFDIYSYGDVAKDLPMLHDKVDLITTFGGDGTILHAASLFAGSTDVPPMLSFSMGTLGFLGEWKFEEYKRAFRETYMSGSEPPRNSVLASTSEDEPNGSFTTGWSSIRGKSMGTTRSARVLVRQRLKVGIFDADGNQLSSDRYLGDGETHAMNEVIIHRGKDPHLAIVEVYVGGRFLTEAVADGMIVSSPTGSTAYSLSSGGCIIHPLVSSLLLTPICPRSLSFRPLILPATTPITLKLSEKNRGRELDVSVDGMRRSHGIGVGTELRVSSEEMKRAGAIWRGGIPCIMRRSRAGAESDDGWVGGLNSLLKFNYPFGEEN